MPGFFASSKAILYGVMLVSFFLNSIRAVNNAVSEDLRFLNTWLECKLSLCYIISQESFLAQGTRVSPTPSSEGCFSIKPTM